MAGREGRLYLRGISKLLCEVVLGGLLFQENKGPCQPCFILGKSEGPRRSKHWTMLRGTGCTLRAWAAFSCTPSCAGGSINPGNGPSCACWVFALLRAEPREATQSLCQEPVSEGGDALRREEYLNCLETLLFLCLVLAFHFFFKSKPQDIQPEILWLLFMYGKYLTVQVRKPSIQKLKGNPKLLGSSQSD